MSRKISTFLIAGTALGFGGVASAQSEATLEASSNLDLAEAYRAELAADAAGRTSLQSGGQQGFTITSADGNSTLNIGGLVQFRYTANFRDDDSFDGVGFTDQNADALSFNQALAAAAAGQQVNVNPNEIGDNDFTHGFNVQRARIDLTGNLAIPNFTYRVSGQFGSAVSGGDTEGFGGEDFEVTWAYGQYDFTGALEGFYARLGIIKAPLYYEELVEPEFLLAAERSLTNEFYSQQYSEGIQLGYDGEFLRAAVAFTDGLATRGTQFNQAGEADIAITGRADFKLAGDWEQFQDFTSFRGSEFGARVGGAVHWETFGDTGNIAPSATATLPFGVEAGEDPRGDIIAYTADAQMEGNGWNIFAAFLGRYEQTDDPLFGDDDDEEEVNDFGVVVQGGYFVTDQIEVFARYDGLFLDEDRFEGADDLLDSEVEENLHFGTFGANYYFIPESQALKFTLDVGISFEETTAALLTQSPSSGGNFLLGGTDGASVTGFLGQDDDTEVVVRGQFQLLF